MKKEIKLLELGGPKPLQFLGRISDTNEAGEAGRVNRSMRMVRTFRGLLP